MCLPSAYSSICCSTSVLCGINAQRAPSAFSSLALVVARSTLFSDLGLDSSLVHLSSQVIFCELLRGEERGGEAANPSGNWTFELSQPPSAQQSPGAACLVADGHPSFISFDSFNAAFAFRQAITVTCEGSVSVLVITILVT